MMELKSLPEKIIFISKYLFCFLKKLTSTFVSNLKYNIFISHIKASIVLNFKKHEIMQKETLINNKY